jgi:hypothetical protein
MESCKDKNYNLHDHIKLIDYFFNRLDNFENYIKYLDLNNKNYPIPEGIKRERLYYACIQTLLNYSYINGLIELFQFKNNCIVPDWDL